MLITVTGGSGSGKSEYAENLAVSLHQGELVYIATMIPYGEEGKRRVERHRKMREKKHFQTIECYTDLMNVKLKKGSTVLLECMSNLAANEVFESGRGFEEACRSMKDGILHLMEYCENLVVVSNEIFSDGIMYDSETARYMEILGAMNCWLGKQSDRVVEVVYSIPVERKI